MNKSTKKRRPKINYEADLEAARKSGKGDFSLQFVLPVGLAGWSVMFNKIKGFTFFTDSKSEALQYARTVAKENGGRIVIEERNGKITKERYRGNRKQ